MTISYKFTFSQTKFNFDFETWVNLGEFKNPDKWDSSNETFMIGTYIPVTRENTPFSGTYSAKLKSTYISQVGSTLIGVLTLGEFEIDTYSQKAIVTGGEAYDGRPEKLTGFYKYNPIDGDTCGVILDLFKFNSVTNKRDTIGSALFKSGANLSEWTYFELPINYFSSEIPDSINVIILSSDTSNIKAGSTLWVDNFWLQGGTENVEDNLFSQSISIFPNPTSNYLNLEINNLKIDNLSIRIMSTDGKVIYSEIFEKVNGFISIDISKYSSGNYFVWLKSEEKTTIKNLIIK